MLVTTIAATNYLAQVRVLARSYSAHHPGERIAVLLIDDLDGAFDPELEPFDIVDVAALPMGIAEYRRMATIYGATEFATALKPFLLELLLEITGDPVAYIDPDIAFYAPIDDLAGLVDLHGIVVTPHLLAPLPQDGLLPDDIGILQAGAYNLGFIGVSPHAVPMLRWWQERLRRDCISQPEVGLFVDQKWIDLVPGIFGAHVLRDPGWNVAYWNVAQRPLATGPDGITADGAPLRFFHFSGFDPTTPDILSKYTQPHPRTAPFADPVLARLCVTYAEDLLSEGYEAQAGRGYPLGLGSDGGPLHLPLRRAARLHLLTDETDGVACDLPDPFGPGGMLGLNRWVLQRNMAREAFPVAWVVRPGQPGDPRGVNLIGYAKAESGMGEITRQLAASLKAADVPYRVIPWHLAVNRQAHPFDDMGDTTQIFDTNIICINADQLPIFAEGNGRYLLAGRRNVGVWAWEVDRFPTWMADSERYLDEVWGISAHGTEAFARAVHRPTRTFTLPVSEAPHVVRIDGFEQRPFTFLFSFDYFSVFERKNPLAVVRAFERAFPAGADGPRPLLVVKSVNGDRFPREHGTLLRAAASHPDVEVVDGYVTAGDQLGMMAGADCYVSLHRAEGYGLTIAEAMALGKPVITTAYSGNLDFVSDETGLLIDGPMVPVGRKSEPYPADATWCDPDVATAAAAMRWIAEHPREAAVLGARARDHIRTHHSPEARRAFLREALLGEVGHHSPHPHGTGPAPDALARV